MLVERKKKKKTVNKEREIKSKSKNDYLFYAVFPQAPSE